MTSILTRRLLPDDGICKSEPSLGIPASSNRPSICVARGAAVTRSRALAVMYTLLVHGRRRAECRARGYRHLKPHSSARVTFSITTAASTYDLEVFEEVGCASGFRRVRSSSPAAFRIGYATEVRWELIRFRSRSTSRCKLDVSETSRGCPYEGDRNGCQKPEAPVLES